MSHVGALISCIFNNTDNITMGTLMMRIRELIQIQLEDLEIKLEIKEKQKRNRGIRELHKIYLEVYFQSQYFKCARQFEDKFATVSDLHLNLKRSQNKIKERKSKTEKKRKE